MLIVTAFFVTVAAGYGFNSTQIIIISGIASGLYYWLEPWISYKVMKGNDRLTSEWALGTGDGFGNFTTALLAKKIGKREESTEDIKFPTSLEWLRDSQIAIAVFSTFVYIILGLLAGAEAVREFSGSTHWIIYLLLNGIYFSASLSILLYGVRIFIAEIVPAFSGFSKKIVPGAIPGLDYPTMFQFAPTGMFIGYLMNLIGGILATVTMVVVRSPVIVLPSIFMNFWTGALLGVFANAWGGRRATFIVPLLWGYIAPFGWALMYPLSGSVLMEAHVLLDYTGALFPWGIPYCLIVKFLAQLFGI
jgi:PTS system ascorbate-specific IIC component